MNKCKTCKCGPCNCEPCTCKACDAPVLKRKKYCSVQCQQDYYRAERVEKIENGDTTLDHRQYRKYLFETVGAKCQLCGWDKVNPISGKSTLEMDHIDGNSTNNSLSNLRLICPNCSSLQATYKNMNKGNGRHYRRERYHAGKSY